MIFSDSWWDTINKTLVEDEGLRHKPYKCTAGKLTIGVGRNIEDRGISDATAFQMLEEDIYLALDDAYKIFTVEFFNSLSQPRQHAILNMILNLGGVRFSKFKNMIAAIRSNDWKLAAKEAKQSLWYQQVKARGDRIIELLENEKYLYKL